MKTVALCPDVRAFTVCVLDELVPGPCVGKKAPCRGKWGMFTHPQTRKWETAAAALFKKAWGKREPLDEPVMIVVSVIADPPKTLLKSTKTWPVWCTTKPDEDNMRKSVGDALQAAGVLINDSRIVHSWSTKAYNPQADTGAYVSLYTTGGKK